MKIMLNGQEKSLKPPATIAGLLQEMGFGERRVAVEVNREIVPRSQHSEFQLKEDDRIEVVLAIGGGGMSREQGPHEVGMRPAANAAGHRRHGVLVFLQPFGSGAHGGNR